MSVVDILQWFAILVLLVGWLVHHSWIHRIAMAAINTNKAVQHLAKAITHLNTNLTAVGVKLGLVGESEEV